MPDIITGISAGVSLFSASAGASAASDSNRLSAEQLQLARERDDYNKGILEESNEFQREDREYLLGRRTREEGLLDPIQEGMAELANKGPDYEGAAARSDADVSQAYGLQRDRERFRREKYGINPASGVSASESRRLGNSEALAKTFGRNRSRTQEDDRDWARKIAVYGTGNMRNVTPQTRLSQLGSSETGSALGAAASRKSDESSGAYQLAGSLFADASDRYDASNTGLPPPSGNTFTGRTGANDDYFDF